MHWSDEDEAYICDYCGLRSRPVPAVDKHYAQTPEYKRLIIDAMNEILDHEDECEARLHPPPPGVM